MSRPSRVRNIERLYHIYISRYILTRTLLFLPADLFWSFSLYNCITLVFYQYVYTAMSNFILSRFPKLFQQNFFLSNGIMFVLLRFYFVFRILKIFYFFNNWQTTIYSIISFNNNYYALNLEFYCYFAYLIRTS